MGKVASINGSVEVSLSGRGEDAIILEPNTDPGSSIGKSEALLKPRLWVRLPPGVLDSEKPLEIDLKRFFL